MKKSQKTETEKKIKQKINPFNKSKEKRDDIIESICV